MGPQAQAYVLEAGLESTSFRVSENIPLYLQCRGVKLAVIDKFRWTVLSASQESWVVLSPWRHCQALMDGAEPSPRLGHTEMLQSTVTGALSRVLCEAVVQL